MHAMSTSVSYSINIQDGPLINDEAIEKAAVHPQTIVEDVKTIRSSKLSHLDGLRGFCAFGVVLWHWICMLTKYEPAYFGQTPVRSFWILPFVNGPLFVIVFFVLSGRVLSDAIYSKVRKASKTGDHGKAVRAIISACIRRPFRLILPILALVYLIISLQMLTGFAEPVAARIEHFLNPLSLQRPHPEEYSPLWILPVDGVGWAITTGFRLGFVLTIQTVVLQNAPLTWYNVLWTMGIEFTGSYVVFGVSIIAVSLQRGSYLIVLAALSYTVYMQHPMAPFVIGVLITHLRYTKVLISGSPASPAMTRFGRLAWTLALIPGFLIAFTFCEVWAGGVSPFREYWIQLISAGMPLHDLRIIAATSIVLGSEISSKVQTFLNHRACQFLGRISYSLYLIHLALWVSVGTWVFEKIYTSEWMGYNLAAFVSLIPCLILAIGLSYLFTISVDDTSVKIARWIGSFFKVHGDSSKSSAGEVRPVGWLSSGKVIRLIPETIHTSTKFLANLRDRVVLLFSGGRYSYLSINREDSVDA